MSWLKRNPQAPRLHSGAPRGIGARSLGGMMLLAGASLGLGGCKVSDVSREGPKPAPTAVQRVDPDLPGEPVVCAEQAGTLEISGSGFSPLPVNTLRDDESLALPRVALVAGEGNRVEVPVSQFDVAAGRLKVTLAANTLAPGTYDVVVENPNGQSGTLSGAVRVVPPPQLTAIEPTSALSATVTPVTLTGAHFRATSDGTLPRAFLTPVGTAVQYGLDGIALPSDTQLTGNTPGTLNAGRYDVTVRNPEGCQATLPGAFEVIHANQIDLADSVDPASGWVEARTTIEIRASNANGKGLLSTPEAFILIGGQEIPLLRESYLSAGEATSSSLMSAVIPSRTDDARMAVGGPYAIKVINPDGQTGIIPDAFTVLKDPPPRIATVSPGRGDRDATVTFTLTGSDFKDPVDDTPVLTMALLAANGTEFPCGPTTVTQGATETDPDTATCQMRLPSTTGGYLVRVRHEDDGSFDTWSLLAVTEASRKLDQTTTAQPSLNTARRAHGIAQGQDDLGNRFLYVVGGENGTSSAIDSGEFASISRFGRLGPWQVLRTRLPQGRTGVSLVRAGRFLYALGGSTDGSTPVATDTVLRAHILGSDSAPVLAIPTATATGGLEEGTWYYRVSAVLADGTVNPLGEGLPSDTESIRVPANGAVSLSWAMPPGAPAVREYRIYRSPSANQVKGNEVYLTTVTTPSYTDDGSATPGTDVPLPVGSLGVWTPMPGLLTPRFDAAATTVRLDASNVFLYVTGGRVANTTAGTLKSTEEAVLSADGGGISSWRAGPDLLSARAEHVLRPVSRALAETVPEGVFAITAAAGTSCPRGGGAGCNAHSSLETATLHTDTTPGAARPWASGGNLTQTRVGMTGMVVNDFYYAFNGWAGSGGSFPVASEKSGSTTCVGGPPCTPVFNSFSSATMSFDTGVRYRSATEFFGAYFYFVGGSSAVADPSTASRVVLRGSY